MWSTISQIYLIKYSTCFGQVHCPSSGASQHRIHAQTAKELKITQILDKLLEYKRSWIQHVNRMSQNILPRVMKYYSPTGRRNHGRPLKRLVDTWDQNRSTSGPTPWNMMMITLTIFFYGANSFSVTQISPPGHNKSGNVHITKHWSAFVQPSLHKDSWVCVCRLRYPVRPQGHKKKLSTQRAALISLLSDVWAGKSRTIGSVGE